MPDAVLLVNGKRYGGWKSVRITRSIESIAGSFDLEVSDRWAGQAEPWAIREEDECKVAIDSHVMITGFVDRRTQQLQGNQRTLTYSGRDRAGALVDCSAVLKSWSFRNIDVRGFAVQLCEPFGIAVKRQPGLRLERVAKISINPGDTCFQAIDRVAKVANALVVSDGAGNVVITQAGKGRAAALVEGRNILAADVEYDGSERFRRYVVVSQVPPLFDDGSSVASTSIRAEALDEGVQRASRVLMIKPEQGLTTAYARKRADWEARVRAARAETVNITVQGWMQPDGTPWPVNARCTVKAPGIGVDGELLISQAEFSLSSAGQVTRLRLVRPDAFLPEPRAVVKGDSLWKV